MSPGMLSNNSRVYPTIVFNIHGPATTNVPAIPISFGINDNVISLICVAA